MLRRKIGFENGIMVALALAALLVLVFPAGKAQAAPYIEYSPSWGPGLVNISNTIGAGTSVTETYQVLCPAGTYGLGASVRDPSPVGTGIFAVSVFKAGGIISKSVFDDIDGDTNSSLTPTVVGGAGIYSVSVTKSSAASSPAEEYWLAVRCWTQQYVIVPIPVPAAGETGSVFYLGVQ
jgi:hypothetical protein